MKNFYRSLSCFLTAVILVSALVSCQININTQKKNTHQTEPITPVTVSSLENVPAYSGSPYCIINGNIPYFTAEEITAVSFEKYYPLDELGRCVCAASCIGKDLMPTEERGSIGSVKPTGWHTVKYDCVDGKYLYNRCHLIGYQLTAENANVCNLITGTRYLNVTGMLPFEDMVAAFIKDTSYHVMYRVTPIFNGENLVADGVLMEARSVEDSGKELEFCVFCYNVQPGVVIDYSDGESRLAGDRTETASGTVTETGEEYYILNTSSKKFHFPECKSVSSIAEANRQEYHGKREYLISQNYEPCKSCNP